MNTMSDNSCELPLQLKQSYALGHKLGAGACGEVRKLFTKDGSKQFAVKIIKIIDLNNGNIGYNSSSNIRNEVEILKKLKHVSYTCDKFILYLYNLNIDKKAKISVLALHYSNGRYL